MVLNFVISGKVTSLHKLIRYVKRSKYSFHEFQSKTYAKCYFNLNIQWHANCLATGVNVRSPETDVKTEFLCHNGYGTKKNPPSVPSIDKNDMPLSAMVTSPIKTFSKNEKHQTTKQKWIRFYFLYLYISLFKGFTSLENFSLIWRHHHYWWKLQILT